MRRGFKADAERRAIASRQSLGFGPLDPLDPWRYAESLGVLVYEAKDLDLEAQHAHQLLRLDPDSWSGMTLFEEGMHVVVLNSAHSQARRATTLMHELAHILLEHLPADVDVSPSGLVLLSDYSTDHEEEADWLGGALLLPEPALLHYRSQGRSIDDICREFGVSAALCTWRCRMTGVDKRLSFRRSA